jgi:hypothetical protein
LHWNLLLPIGSKLPAPTPMGRRRIMGSELTEPTVFSDTEDISSDESLSEVEFILRTGTTSKIQTPDDQNDDNPGDTKVPSKDKTWSRVRVRIGYIRLFCIFLLK